MTTITHMLYTVIDIISTPKGSRDMREELNVEELFASKVFTLGKMKERLPKSTYKEVKKVMDQGGELSLATADVLSLIHI